MTRWAALLEALGVDAERFALEHQSKFDLSPRQWVRDRLEELAKDDDAELVEGLVDCDQPCCARSAA